MKKISLIIILSLVAFSLQAQDSTWTIVKSQVSGYSLQKSGYFYAGPSLKNRLGKVEIGSKVYPIQQREDVYHVRFVDGQIGWVYFTMLKETQPMEITTNTALYSIKGSGSFRMGKFIDSLKKGAIVTRFGLGKDGGVHYVKTEKGKKGAVIRQYAKPLVEKIIPAYQPNKAYEFHFKKDIDSDILQKSDTILKEIFGNPEALVFNKDKDTWFYTNIETYDNKLRYEGIKFFVKDHIVISDSVIGKGNSTFVDKLPLYLTVKKMNFFKSNDSSTKISLFKNASKRHWTIRFLIRIFQLILGILFISIAHFFVMFITMRIAHIPSLNNGIVLLIGYILSISLNYLYFIILLAHIIQQPYFLIFAMAVVLYFSLKTITSRINYHRCPRCHTMWSAKDEGSKITGQTHLTENKSKRKFSHTTQTSYTKTDHYVTEKWKEYSTEQDIKDLRQCANCGYRWNVERTETVSGHV